MKVIIKTINVFLGCCIPKKVGLSYSVGLPENKRNERKTMKTTITNEQKIKITLTPKTATGKPVGVDGKPTWEVLSGDGTVEPAEDGLSAYLISGETPGLTSVLVTADADIGEGVEEIQALIELDVVGARASSLGITVGDPESKEIAPDAGTGE